MSIRLDSMRIKMERQNGDIYYRQRWEPVKKDGRGRDGAKYKKGYPLSIKRDKINSLKAA